MCLCCIACFHGVSTTHLYGLVLSVIIITPFQLGFGTVNAHASAGCAYRERAPLPVYLQPWGQNHVGCETRISLRSAGGGEEGG